MTDLLKDTLTDQADRAQPSPLDLDAIINTGDRRLRRRRVLTTTGTAMITLAVLITGLTLLKPAEDHPAPVSTPFTERRATYAIGSQIHFGQDVISIAPKKVSALVQIDSGFVFTTVGEDGLFFADGKQVRRLPAVAGELTPLTAAPDGNLVGWVEGFGDRFESVIYDVTAGREVVRTSLGNKTTPNLSLVESPRIIAIDSGYAYFGTLQGVYRWDLKTGAHQEIVKTLPHGVRTVAAGRYLYQRPLQHPVDGVNLALADKPGDHNGSDYPGNQGWLSPTADYLLTAPNDPQHITPPPADLRLFLATTGAEAQLNHPGHPRLIFSQWLTKTTFTAAGLRTTAPNSPVDLLTCSVESLTCTTTTPSISTFTFPRTAPRTAPFTLPIGTPIYQLYG